MSSNQITSTDPNPACRQPGILFSFPIRLVLSLITGIILFSSCCSKVSHELSWPEITSEAKPWTRWWWPGNSVNMPDLTREMEAISAIGMGGVEITPTYGARGWENRFIQYLSPEWFDVFSHTLSEARRLGLGVDMATGTGWNFGGPTVTDDAAPQRVVYKKFELNGGQSLPGAVSCLQAPYIRFVLNQVYEVSGSYRLKGERPVNEDDEPVLVRSVSLPDISQIRQPLSANENLQALAIDQVIFGNPMPLQVIMAYSDAGEVLDLTAKVGEDGILDWIAPAGKWKLYAVFRAQTGKLVERAAPGGEGFMINYMSENAVEKYLAHMDSAFAGCSLEGLRAYFNDSYELDDARFACDWTPEFFHEFFERRGYDLKHFLPALFGEDSPEINRLVISDYRETVSDLILDRFTRTWAQWSHRKGKVIRNQAHGSPANILDLYAASDIPETEGVDLIRIKFASSAAHVSGKKLTSSESATFLNENFTSTLLDLKKNLDRSFIGGVNHVCYHGTAFTPSSEPWPGWFFYVAIHLNPRNPIWNDSRIVHRYVANTQSFLQSGIPANDILLYYPVYDRYAELDTFSRLSNEGDGPTNRMINRFSFDDRRWMASSFRELAGELQNNGFTADYISDLQVSGLDVDKKKLSTGGTCYKVILVPECSFIPLETFRKLFSLARKGATIIFLKSFPADVPGMVNREERQQHMLDLKNSVSFTQIQGGMREAGPGKGRIIIADNVEQALRYAGVSREGMVDHRLLFNRRSDDLGTFYFISNFGENPFAGWISLSAEASAAALFDPMSGTSGIAAFRKTKEGRIDVYLELDPWQSILVKTFRSKISGDPYSYYQTSGETLSLDGPWNLDFVEGGPGLPEIAGSVPLGSWTDLEGDLVKKFSGTAVYSLDFPKPAVDPDGWWLDLGKVAESATVVLNGQEIAVLIGPVFRVFVDDDLLKENNRLEVRVTNLAANRIAELDKRGVEWKKFYNNNIRPLRAENRGPDGMFSARNWEPGTSGLIGPVRLIPLSGISPE